MVSIWVNLIPKCVPLIEWLSKNVVYHDDHLDETNIFMLPNYFKLFIWSLKHAKKMWILLFWLKNEKSILRANSLTTLHLGGTVPPFCTHLGGTFVYSELPLSQMSVDDGWPCLGCWRSALGAGVPYNKEKKRKSSLHPPPTCMYVTTIHKPVSLFL